MARNFFESLTRMLVATDPADGDKLTERIRARIDGLPAAIVRVLDFIDSHRLDTLTLTAADIGVLTNTSDATVIRAVKALGYDGLNDLKEELSGCFGQGQSPACIAEARRLRKRVVLITDFEDFGFAGRASAVINVHRGQAGRISLHGATFVCLEAISLAIASRQKSSAVMSLKRLHELRKSVSKLTSTP